MSEEELKDLIQQAISKPENKYPFVHSKGTSGNLHVWLIDPAKATESVIKLLKNFNLIK